ncbi:MAG: FecR domain-containing protein [Planctomycetes bacterium]|nr:FecR domain-containing protein [Planctomycetota bacterium]
MEPGPCPDLALLAAACDGLLPGPDREAALAHLDACPACLSQVSAAASGAAWMEAPARRRGLRRRAGAVAAAAILAGSALAGWAVARRGGAIDPIFEGRLVAADGEVLGPRIAGDTAMPRSGGTLAFRDGTRAVADPGSVLRVASPGDGERLRLDLDAGGVRMEVPPVPGRVRVRTPVGDVTVLGTRFSVRLAPGFGDPPGAPPRYLGVEVERGCVAVRANGHEVLLSAGHRAHLLSGGAPIRQAAQAQDGDLSRITDRLGDAVARGDRDGATLALEMLRALDPELAVRTLERILDPEGGR